MADLALGKVRIADLTNVIAGPVSTRVLAQLGAEVIKVELPWGRAIGNITMHASGSGNRPYNQVTSFNEVNRAKKSIAMDLTHEEGRKAFLELVSISDIVIQNYSPRVMANLGLDYENLRAVKPDIIMISMPAGRPLEPIHIVRPRDRRIKRTIVRYRISGWSTSQTR